MYKAMKIRTLLLALFLLPAALLAARGLSGPPAAVQAAPAYQVPIYTPTPGPDGRIIYIVQPNDTLLRISLLSGVPVTELRALNNLTGDTIIAGQKLLLGLAGPAEITPTPGPTPTPTPVLPTPSPQPGTGTLCVILFNDVNGDSVRQEDSEGSIPNGAISFNNRGGTVSKTIPTEAGEEPVCFEEIPEGEYNVTVALPSGYNPTLDTTYALSLKAGDTAYLDFGAQVNSSNQVDGPVVIGDPEKRSPLFGIIGGVFLLAGLSLALFAGRWMRGK